MRRKTTSGLLALTLFVFCSCAYGQYYGDSYDVPYVPTRYNVVDKMLEMADVNGNDILYDLGCGDGRIVIAAAQKFGTHGVGVDINPVRIKESLENAIKAEVTDKVRFIEGNLFETPIGEATVVTLYLLPSVNLKLRPKLFSELKPGTRIVSHDFNMGEWEPDKSDSVENDDNQSHVYNHSVFFWILPANVSGTWELTVTNTTENKPYILHFEQKFQELDGNLVEGDINTPLMNVTLEGDRLQFSAEEMNEGKKTNKLFYGRVNGNSLEGTVKTNEGERPWTAHRDQSTIKPIEGSD